LEEEAIVRSRIVLFLVLAVAVALVAVYLGWSTSTPKAAGEPWTAMTAGAPVGAAHKPTSGSGPVRSPTAFSQQTGQNMGSPKAAPPKAAPPKTPPPKASTPNVGPPKACSSAAPQPPVSTIVSDPPPPAADQVYFGQVSITSFDDSAQMSISPDYQALTTTFANFVIEMVKGKGACDVTRSLSMTLPVTGPAQAGRLGFYVQGFAFVEQGATARLTLRGNGQVKVRTFSAGFNDSYIQALKFPVTPQATYTVSVQLEVHQNPDTGETPTSTCSASTARSPDRLAAGCAYQL